MNKIYYNSKNDNDRKFEVKMTGYSCFNIASFSTYKQMKRFFKKINCDFIFNFETGMGETKKTIEDVVRIEGFNGVNGNYKKLKKQLKGKKLKGFSNGSIVDNFYIESDYNIVIVRINPNNKKYYKPLSTKKAIKHKLTKGYY